MLLRFLQFSHTIEGIDIGRFRNQEATLSFWVRSSRTGIYSVQFQNQAANFEYVTEYTINAADTWERKDITLTFDGGNDSDWVPNEGVRGIGITWTLGSGATATGSLNTWGNQTGSRSANQVNFLETLGNIYRITQVQLTIGRAGAKFSKPGWGDEFIRCKRFFEKSYNHDVNPGTNTEVGVFHGQSEGNTTEHVLNTQFTVAKSKTPTVSFTTPAGTANSVRNRTAAADVAASSFINQSLNSTGRPNSITAQTADDVLAWHYTAAAEV